MVASVSSVRRVAGLVTVATVAITSSGCWGLPGQGPDRRAHNSAERAITSASVGDLEEAWRGTVSDGNVGSPVSNGTGVFVNDLTRTYGFNAGTGAPLWSHEVNFDGSATFANQVLMVGDDVLAGGHFPGLFAGGAGELLDPVTGAVEAPVGEHGEYDAIRGNHAVATHYMANSSFFEDVVLEVYDLADPTKNWGDSWVGVLGAYGAFGTPTVGSSAFYIPFMGKLRAYTLTEPPDIVPAPPEGAGTKAPLWESSLSGISTAVVLDAGGSAAYVGAGNAVHALDTATGASLWSTDVGAAVTATPAFDGEHLFVPTGDGDLVVVAADGSGVAWTASTGSPLTVQPAIAGPTGQGVVFTGSSDGTVATFPATCPTATCPALWSVDAGNSIGGAPAVANGKVFVGSGNELVAYGL